MSEEKKEVTVSKKTTWINRAVSAAVGVIVAVGSMFGITNSMVSEQKAKVKSVKTLASDALTAIKAGDITVATAKLQEAVETGKEVAVSAKEVVEKVKETDSKSVVETAKKAATEALVKDEAKKVEDASKDIKKTKTGKAKKTDAKVSAEVKKVEQSIAVYK